MKFHDRRTIEITYKKLYFFSFCLWFFTEILSQSTIRDTYGDSIDRIELIINITVFISLMSVIIFFQQYTRKEFLIIAVITIIIIFSTINAGRNTILVGWMFIVASKYIDFRELSRIAFMMLIIGIILVVILYATGVIADRITYRDIIERHSLGFSHPNILGQRVTQFVVLYYYVRWYKLRVHDYILLFFITSITIVLTLSLTAMICIFVVSLLVLVTKIINHFDPELIIPFGRILMIVGIVLTILCILFYYLDVTKIEVMSKLNFLMSDRFSQAHIVYNRYGIKPFGQYVYTTGELGDMQFWSRRTWLDSAYANLWIRYGYITMIVFLLSYFAAFKKNKRVPVMAIVYFTYILYGIMEQALIWMTHNVFLVTLAWILYSDRLIEELDPPKTESGFDDSTNYESGIYGID